MIRQTKGEKIFNIINVSILFVLVVVMLYPCIHVLWASLSDSNQLMIHGGFLLYPQGFTLAAYEEVFQNQLIWSGYGNTLINLVLALILNISLTTLGAYALSRKELMVRRPIMLMIIFTMFFSGGMIPNYILVRSLGMVDTRWALFIPTAISAYNLIIMRTSLNPSLTTSSKPPSWTVPAISPSCSGWLSPFPRRSLRSWFCSTPWNSGTHGSPPSST